MTNETLKFDTQKDLVNHCFQGSRIDFIARCITPWHLLGIEAFASDLSSQIGRQISGIILILPHCITGYSINYKKINKLKGVYYTLITEQFFLENNLNKAFNNLLHKYNQSTIDTYQQCIYIISPSKPWTSLSVDLINKNFNAQIMNVVLDDGVASYETPMLNAIKQFMENKLIKNFLKTILDFPYEKFLEKKYKYSIMPLALFNSVSKRLKANNKVISIYRKELERRTDNEEIMFFSSKYCIILTQPFSKSEWNIKAVMENFLLPLKTKIEEQGIEVFIKPHPREINLDYYSKFNLINSAKTVEEFICSCDIKPEFLLGIYSTALVTSQLFFDIRAISIGKCIMPYITDNNLRTSINQFINNFIDYVLFVESIENLEL